VWYLPSQIPRYTEFPRTNSPVMGEKAEKTRNWWKIPLLSTNQKTAFI